jgi:signal recognition particle subunit SRP68
MFENSFANFLGRHIIASEGLQYEVEQMQTIEDKITAYDKIFMSLEDAKSQIRDDITHNLQKGDKGDAELTTTLQKVRNMVEAKVLHRKRERDLLLVQQLIGKLQAAAESKDKQQARKAAKPEDVVKMFETLLNANEELIAIPGVKDNEAMAKLCAGRSLLFKAWRILYLAHSYLMMKQYAQAAALFVRAEQLEIVARQRLLETPARDAVDNTWLDKLQTAARLGKAETLAASATQAASATSSSPGSFLAGSIADSVDLKKLSQTPLSTRLNNYEAAVYGDGKAPKLVDFPPPIEAVACKPVLFDLALNKASYPDLTNRCQQKKAGFMSKLFGRK